MKKEKLELIRGSGNIYQDFNVADADTRQAEAILAAEIISALLSWKVILSFLPSSSTSTPGIVKVHFGS